MKEPHEPELTVNLREQPPVSLEASIKNSVGDADQDVALNPDRDPGFAANQLRCCSNQRASDS